MALLDELVTPELIQLAEEVLERRMKAPVAGKIRSYEINFFTA